MKIGHNCPGLPEGKVKYSDDKMQALVDKCRPKKVTPFYAEFIKDEFVHTDVIVIPEGTILDILILDMEKCEARIARSEDPDEKALMQKCITYLEQEKPLGECAFSEEEMERLRKLAPISLKPVLQIDGTMETNYVILQALEKANIMFFYTAGPKEVHAWPIAKDADIVTCAGRIHTDLARGFIKGEVVSYHDFMQCHSFNDCRKKGLVNVVDRGHRIQNGDIIEIRFNV